VINIAKKTEWLRMKFLEGVIEFPVAIAYASFLVRVRTLNQNLNRVRADSSATKPLMARRDCVSR
jgi:hypothetical protein